MGISEKFVATELVEKLKTMQMLLSWQGQLLNAAIEQVSPPATAKKGARAKKSATKKKPRKK